MNVLLLNPTNYSYPVEVNFPYSICALGSYLVENGYSVKLLDGSVEEEIEEKLKSLAGWTDLLGISLMTPQIKSALQNLKSIKKYNPNIKVVVGGAHPSLLPEETITCNDIDYVITGEGEGALKDLIDCLGSGKNPHHVPNLVYKRNGTIKINPERPIEDINKLPRLNWKLLNPKVIAYMKKNRVGAILAGKGCNFKCTFCFNSVAANKYRYRSSENMIADLSDLINNYNVKNVYIRDEIFFQTTDRLLKFADMIIENNINVKWTALGRVSSFRKNKIDDFALRKLIKSGLKQVKFGAESGSQVVLNKLKKGITVEQILNAARMLKKHEVEGNFSFMVGLPGEAWEQFMETLDLIDRIKEILGKKAIVLGPHAFFIYPCGTLYQECIEFGYKEPKSLKEWANLEHHQITGLPDYYWKDHKHYQFIRNIALIVGFNFFPIYKIFLPPYRLRNITGLIELPFIIVARLRWKFRFFGVKLIEMKLLLIVRKVIAFIKKYLLWLR